MWHGSWNGDQLKGWFRCRTFFDQSIVQLLAALFQVELECFARLIVDNVAVLPKSVTLIAKSMGILARYASCQSNAPHTILFAIWANYI